MRASKKVSILDNKGIEAIEKKLAQQQFLSEKKFKQIKEDREEILRKKLLA
jgi:exopolyphosphatase/pppGpp-phosphohydrolase